MRRVAFLAAALVVGAAGSSASAKPAHQLFGIVGQRGAAELTALDPQTLTPVGGRVRLRTAGPWAFSPDRKRLAIATGFAAPNDPLRPVRLRFVDLWQMRLVANVRIAPDPRLTTGQINPVVLVAWLDPDHVLVLRRRADRTLQLATVSASTWKIVRRQPFAGEVLAAAYAGRELALLVGQAEELAEPRLVVVDGDGDSRQVALRRMRAGWTWDSAADPPVTHYWQPGLAADGAERIAYVVEPNGLVAAVPLDSLEPTYRSVHGRYAKLAAGSSRRAIALGNGLLAIAGSESSVGTNDRGPYQVTRPAGLQLLDTKSWTLRPIDESTANVTRWRDGLVVTGWTWDSREAGYRGSGLALYGVDGTEKFRVFDGRAVSVVAVYGDRAYTYVMGTGERAIVDLTGGRVLQQRKGDFPWLLHAEPSPW